MDLTIKQIQELIAEKYGPCDITIWQDGTALNPTHVEVKIEATRDTESKA